MAVPDIIIYTKKICPYCDHAKQLLSTLGVSYQEIKVDEAGPERLEEMIKRSGGRRTVPQIFINGQSVGGFDDLRALQASGELAQLLDK